MKEPVVRMLGGQLGSFIKMDSSFLGYMWVRVGFPLSKALVPQLTIRIKGKGLMNITVRYENILHFCFSCGRIGHAAMNCEVAEEDPSVKFGEEVHVSPPRRSRNIVLRDMAPRAARPLFQTGSQRSASLGASYGGRGSVGNVEKVIPSAAEQDVPARRLPHSFQQEDN
jgi:hypothetical protein